MTFMRIWTALLAGSCLALVSTLSYAAARGLIASPPIDRPALYDVFLAIWFLASLVCVAPAMPLGQWLAAVRLSAFLLGALCLLTMFTSRDILTLAVTAVSAALLALLNHALTGPGINREQLASPSAHPRDRQ